GHAAGQRGGGGRASRRSLTDTVLAPVWGTISRSGAPHRVSTRAAGSTGPAHRCHGHGAYEPQGDHLVGQAGPAVLPLGDAELLVEAEQVLLDRRFGDHEHFGDVACGGGCDEGLFRQRGAAQCVQDIELPTGEFGGRAAAQFDVGAELFALEAADPTAGTAEGEHVAFFQDTSCDRASVDAGSVAGQAQVDDVDVGASTDEFGVKL